MHDYETLYGKLYAEHKRTILAHEEHKMALFDQIERLQLKLWKYDEESNARELYLVEKIERLEKEVKQKEEAIAILTKKVTHSVGKSEVVGAV